ncbi:hypothetical protein RhiirC2_791617 [Rhizophagus irregularis]|uniref:Uncharacterized protein n=1 Tax=Rhizophagus irregularis TaxID=588596 RepID=A0A2N1MIY8_9GLOM|nr:hypothetical protein RhiirC2_791617 [Rhizophagus irregularis]
MFYNVRAPTKPTRENDKRIPLSGRITAIFMESSPRPRSGIFSSTLQKGFHVRAKWVPPSISITKANAKEENGAELRKNVEVIVKDRAEVEKEPKAKRARVQEYLNNENHAKKKMYIKAQGILDRINNNEQAVYDLYEDKRRYEEARRIVDRIMREKNFNLDEVCSRIAIEISDYDIGKICAQTIKDFYKNNSHNKTIDKIKLPTYDTLFKRETEGNTNELCKRCDKGMIEDWHHIWRCESNETDIDTIIKELIYTFETKLIDENNNEEVELLREINFDFIRIIEQPSVILRGMNRAWEIVRGVYNANFKKMRRYSRNRKERRDREKDFKKEEEQMIKKTEGNNISYKWDSMLKIANIVV